MDTVHDLGKTQRLRILRKRLPKPSRISAALPFVYFDDLLYSVNGIFSRHRLRVLRTLHSPQNFLFPSYQGEPRYTSAQHATGTRTFRMTKSPQSYHSSNSRSMLSEYGASGGGSRTSSSRISRRKGGPGSSIARKPVALVLARLAFDDFELLSPLFLPILVADDGDVLRYSNLSDHQDH